MVAKSSAKEPDFSSFVDDLEKSYAPAFICKNPGDYFIGAFTGEMNWVTTNPEYGEVLVLEFVFMEGTGTVAGGAPHDYDKGEVVSYWFTGMLQHNAIVALQPKETEIVGVYNKGKKRNKANTFTYNDMRVKVLGRPDEGNENSRKATWETAKPIEESDPALSED